MHKMIVSPQAEKFVIVRPGARKGIQIDHAMYQEIADVVSEGHHPIPGWLSQGAQQAWELYLSGLPARGTVLVRPVTRLNYSRATWEINKGCNFDCEHCYLAERKFEGLSWEDKTRLLHMLRDAGVLWLQFTGGEPVIDRHFIESYAMAYDMGMMLDVLTNGSRLHRPEVIGLFGERPPNKVAVSLYGATEESFDGLTRKKGAFKLVCKGLEAAREASIPIELALVITKHNAHEVDAMRALADKFGATTQEYGSISPTYDGSSAPLSAQAPGFLDKAAIFKGCPAGRTFFHVDPHGFATMCKIGRENPVSLMGEGLEGLLRLPAVAEAQMLRTGGCSGCQLSGTCRVCRPLAKAYQKAKAPLQNYCQHGEMEETP